MTKVVKVKFEDKEYEFTLRYITYGERKRVLKKCMKGEEVDYAEAEHLILAYSLIDVKPEGLIDMDLKKKSFDKFLKALEDIPRPILVPVAVEAVKLNPLMD